MTHTRTWRIASLPDGYTVDDLRELELNGQVQVAEPDAEALALAAEATKTAAPPLINAAGQPTILKVVAWMLHTDTPNANGDYFVREEIQGIAPALFRAPNFGVMDWNHSAVLGYNDDPPIIGVWYKAEFAFDQAALGGIGAWGVLVTGMVFAWLFPDQANEMIADQTRDGGVRFSMAAIPASTEFRKIGGREVAVLHNPVFFTNSALNKPPADKDATGMVSESPDASSEQMAGMLLNRMPPIPDMPDLTYPRMQASGAGSAGLTTATTSSGNAGNVTATVPWNVAIWDTASHPSGTHAGNGTVFINVLPNGLATKPEEKAMNEEMIKALEAEKAAAEAKIGELAAKLALAESNAATEGEELETLTARIAELEGLITDMQTKVDELTTSRDALVNERDQAVAAATAAEAQIAELAAKVTAFEAAAAERERGERLAARLASLPEEFVKVHSARDEATRERLESKWVAFETEAEWEDYKKHELLGYTPAQPRLGYRQRSENEGMLAAGEQTSGLAEKLAAVIKK